MINVAVFASGKGSNAANLQHFFKNHPSINIVLFAGNKKDAGISQLAKELHLPFWHFSAQEMQDSSYFLSVLRKHQIDWIVLAGFLLKIPEYLTKEFPSKIINIHPALLPKYGGKGMYGEHVHRAVLAAKEKESGISIHLIDENYDAGELVFQAYCEIDETDDLLSLQKKIQQLEHSNFPKVVEKLILEKENSKNRSTAKEN